MSSENVIRGCVEVGGTTVRIAVASQPNKNITKQSEIEIIEKIVMRTSDRDNILKTILEMFLRHGVDTIGIASFGPLDLNKNSPTWGNITIGACKAKESWVDFSLSQELAQNVFNGDRSKVFLVSDVYGAALAEFQLGGHEAIESLAYITVGTGVGVGLYIHGVPNTVMCKREGGHNQVKRHQWDIENEFNGCCTCHNNCVDGQIGNTAIAARLGISIDQQSELPDTHFIWDIVAYYLGQLCTNIRQLIACEKIVIGGGIMNRDFILDKVRDRYSEQINNYIDTSSKFFFGLKKLDLESYMRLSTIDDAGLYGACLLDN